MFTEAYNAVKGYCKDLYNNLHWPPEFIRTVSNTGELAFIHNGNFVETKEANILYWWGKYYTITHPVTQLAARPVQEYSDPFTTFLKEYKDDEAYYIIYTSNNIFILNYGADRFMFGINSQCKFLFIDVDTLEILPFRQYYKHSNEFCDYTREGDIFTIGGRKYKLGRAIDLVITAVCHYRVFLCDEIYFVAFWSTYNKWVTSQLYLENTLTKPALHLDN